MAGIPEEKSESSDEPPYDSDGSRNFPLTPDSEGKAKKPKRELTKDEQFLKEFLARSFGLRPPPKQVLSTVDIQGIANLISEGKVRKVITMAGAGISTSAGIPDFRSMNTGLYFQLDQFNLPRPEALFSIDYFKENPIPYYTVRKRMLLENYKPTPCHYFIRMLAEKGILLRHFTQNIDGLERLAGIDPELLMEAHGSNRTGHCLDCSATYTATWIKDCLMRDEIPKCTAVDCKGVIKPDTVFYGESLPKRFNELVDQDFHQCDLLIIMGTSLKVQPFASITNKVPEETPRLYINLEKNASESKHPLCILIFGGGFKFDDDDNYRDVFLQSDCDEGCHKLAELIGWKDELSNLVTTEHARLEKEFKVEQEKVKHLPVLNELFSQISLQNGAKKPCNQKPDQSQQQKDQTETTHASTPGSSNQKPCQRGKQTAPANQVQDSTKQSPSANKSKERTKSVTNHVKHKKK